MKIAANRKSLFDALSLAVQAVPTRPHKEVLTNVLITADPNHCTLYATDLDVVVKAEFVAEVEAGGSVLAPARLLLAMLREMPDEAVLLDVKKATLHVRGASSQHQCQTVKTDEFPALPDPKWKATVEVPGRMFALHLKAILPQAEETDSRYAIGSVFVELSKGKVCLVATDGNAMGAAELPIDSGEEAAALVPKKSARLLCGLDSDSVTLRVADNWLAAESSGVLMIFRQTEGRFPRWRDVLSAPASPDMSSEVRPSDLMSVIKRTCIAAPDAAQGPQADLIIGGGDLTIRCSVNGSESESRIPCDAEGKIDQAFNWKYLLEAAAGFGLIGDEPASLKQRSGGAMHFNRDQLSFVVMPKVRS